jgi:FkbH-like protein
MRANEERSRALAITSDDSAAYFRELGVRLSVAHGLEEQLPRVAELSRKTNQFNLALRRCGAPELRRLLADPAYQISTAGLADRLSDSGVIAIAVSERLADRLVVHELCISCRALGRQLEDLIVAQLLVSGPAFAGATEVVLPLRDGPRNGPARAWLAQFAGIDPPAAPALVNFTVPVQTMLDASINEHVTTEVLS